MGTTINEVYKNLRDITDYQLTAEHGPQKAGETRRIFLEAKKADKHLDWKPTIGLNAGLRETVNYFREVEATN